VFGSGFFTGTASLKVDLGLIVVPAIRYCRIFALIAVSVGITANRAGSVIYLSARNTCAFSSCIVRFLFLQKTLIIQIPEKISGGLVMNRLEVRE
jgi:hypothetical protein